MAGVRGFSKEENKRRYKLHREVRKSGTIVLTRERTVLVPMEEAVSDKNIIELGKVFGYIIQTVAFSNDR